MSLKKIKENFYEELGMNKYDFFEKVADYIGNFPIIIDGFYFDNTSVGDGEYLYASINNVSYEIDTVSKEVKRENSGCIYVFYSEEDEIEVYYEYEELLLYFITYYLKNIHCYGDMIGFIEQELIKYSIYENEFRNYKVNLNIKNIFIRDNLRNFLYNYNLDENKYILGLINYQLKEINYWDINIKKKFFSYLLGSNNLKEFLNENKKKFIEKEKDFFGMYDGYDIKFLVSEKDESFIIEYNNYFLMSHNNSGMNLLYGNSYGKFSNLIYENEAKVLIPEKYKNEREKENIEIICKKDFLKELEIIVNAYKDIYNDIEIEEMFENFKENF